MLIDHTAYVFVPSESILYFVMRLTGRITAPVMSFFIAEGFCHTRNLKKYFSRMLIFAVISQPFYFVMIFGRIPQNITEFLMNLNVMFNFCISLILLKILSGNLQTEKKIILTAICFAFADLCDWSFMIQVWVLIFFFFKDSKIRYSLFISMTVILMTLKYLPLYSSFLRFAYQYGTVLALVPLHFYSGKHDCFRNQILQKVNRWFFYAFYPFHMFIILILNGIL